jgi:L-serine dehydratase
MAEVGHAMPASLRETARGGLAVAPSARAACAACGACG